MQKSLLKDLLGQISAELRISGRTIGTEQRERRRNVSEREFEQTVERLMKQDLAVGTEAFRDNLLARCLSVLGSEAPARNTAGNATRRTVGYADEDPEARVPPDSTLELLSAAGPPYKYASADVRTDADLL